jgi:putative ABC transport system permease protein
MIMVIVLVLEVRITDCVPEVNRSRSLYMKAMSIHQKGDTSDNSSNGCMSLTVAKECFKALTVPEALTEKIIEKINEQEKKGGKWYERIFRKFW